MKPVSLRNYRIFFLSGKGGVGKSTLSTALALALSKRGFKTLLVSLDPAHSLSILLKKGLGGAPREVAPSLSAFEVDLEREMRDYLKKVERDAEKIISPALIEKVKNQIELAYNSPGALELATVDSVYRIVKNYGRGFDKIVFDTAPSGYTVRLMASPDKLLNWVDSLIEMREEALNYRKMAGEEVKEDPVLSILRKRREEYRFLGELFRSDKTLFGVVVNPGELPLKIGERTLKEIEEAGVPVRLILANKFREKGGELFKKPTLYFPPLEKEPLGLTSLEPLVSVFEKYIG